MCTRNRILQNSHTTSAKAAAAVTAATVAVAVAEQRHVSIASRLQGFSGVSDRHHDADEDQQEVHCVRKLQLCLALLAGGDF